MQITNKTIAGIATPPGTSGIGIVRISGEHALSITKKMFQPKANKQLLPRTATLGTISGNNFKDTCIAIYFCKPQSFTGEHTVELQCHGGYFLLEQILATAISHGAAPAQNGEFSRQAFLNGKLSLDQAESIIDIINAESNLQLQNASLTYRGALKEKLNNIEQMLIEISAQVEATLDYPEEDIAHIAAPDLSQPITALQYLADTARAGSLIKNGINVAIVGKPNAGKSSLFNALLNHERSIVTEIAGTTTDTVTQSIEYQGIKINFTDTAGLRESTNKIEKLGIKRTHTAVQESDIVIAVMDSSQEQSAEDTEILELIKYKPHIIVHNKADLCAGKTNKTPHLSVSALKQCNIENVKQEIFKKATREITIPNDVVITNARHLDEINKALDSLNAAATAPTLDCAATDIATALFHIGNITGTNASEAVLDAVFSRFCLGK